MSRYLGFENDLSFKYIPVKQVEINYGFSYYLSSPQMRFLPKIQDENKIAVWSYLMVSYSFTALKRSRSKNSKP
ncbi:MAG: hypothetical protein EAZ89_11760 [Bacteroidetes bacterium]|nr:MAG: hypothetical protein EAZ89_11760 [Bacteroidota bacterium]